MQKYTPMMEQYLKIKSDYEYTLLLFRVGDFYELFFNDAIVASKELDIALTSKSCGQGQKAYMCGVPFHSIDSYISKLVNKGFKVAICEQVEESKNTKTLVKRDVVRVITPGTVLDNNLLDEGKNNYICAIFKNDKGFGISICDVSTGEFIVTKVDKETNLIDEIAKYNPAEIICNSNINKEISDKIYDIFNKKCYVYKDWVFEFKNAESSLKNHFKVNNLLGYGLENENLCVQTSGALIYYLLETQKNDLSHITTIRKYSEEKYMFLDISSRRNLELTETIREKNKKGSLLWILEKTQTSMGSRLIRKWIEQPLITKDEILKRLEAVEELKNNYSQRAELRELLNTIYDVERLMSRVIYETANARELISIKNSFKNLPFIKEIIKDFSSEQMTDIFNKFDDLQDLFNLINTVIADEPPFSIREGGLIKDGYNDEIDKLRLAKNNGSSWLLQLEQKERNETGIKTLKIKYNKVFGYYIEVRSSNLSLVPDRYIRKQTTSNGERYITSELKEIEETILNAEEKIVELEYNIFCKARKEIGDNIKRIQDTSENVSIIDVLQSLAEVAYTNNYVKPSITEDNIISIKNGRHPVVDYISNGEFIPNDTYLDDEDESLIIITGPNMSGKSTYMRQTALITLMAQIGSFVPAESVTIGIVDRIFTRVGASDDLATGQSTFMVEMSEVANILNNATNRSLLILDEIGRGTSTYDGLSIAWAVLEYIADKGKIGSRTLFATHYHEITELEDRIKGVRNYQVSVDEIGSEIVFLHKIIKGKADNSYGLHVAKLAGIPNIVLKRALDLLKNFNLNDNKSAENIGNYDFSYDTLKYIDKSQDIEKLNEFKKYFKDLDINKLSPLEALSILNDLKNKLL